MHLSYDSVILFLGIYPEVNESIYPHKCVQMDVRSCFSCDSPKLDTMEMGKGRGRTILGTIVAMAMVSQM